jgi:BirA family biotin operon repressor/biotin-[acetyl-CoA-carboxylase] ligase
VQPEDPPAPTLALVAAVALREIAAVHAPRVRIKWPNDLVVDGAKLAGILLERQGDAVIIGFGVNLAHCPDDLARPATSLAALTGASPAPGDVAELLARNLSRWVDCWRTDGVAAIRTAWLAAAHPPGTPLATPEGVGLFDGLDDTGALRLLLPGGAVRVIHAGDVFLI